MTKLKQPIVVTITTAECASMLSEILAKPFAEFSERIQKLGMSCRVPFGTGIGAQITNQLTAQGIDYRTWEPPQPLLVGPHEVSASPDGSVTVGCTTVNRHTLEAIFKLSSEAMGGDWPKFTKSNDGHVLEFHQDHSASIWHSTTGVKMPIRLYGDYKEAIRNGHTPLTPAAAREILEAKG